MPTSVFKELGLGRTKPTTIILQLAYQSVTRPDGIVEDVLVQVGSLIFPVDFVVLNFEPDSKVPFILGHPFLATDGVIIDVEAGKLTMRAHDKVEVFDVYRTLKLLEIYKNLSAITAIDLAAESIHTLSTDPLERVLMGQDIFGDSKANGMVQFFDLMGIYAKEGGWEPLNRPLGPLPKPSIE